MLGGEMVKLMMRDVSENDAYLECCYDITVYHHERWDGSGYPTGISGEVIPLSARILSLVDVYDALTTSRVYKEAMSHEEAVEVINEGAGTQFDANVVDAFMLIQNEFKQYITQQE
jgi:putative two-component system response regulator